MQKTVLVVCRGNIGRSPFTEAVLAKEVARQNLSKEVQVISRGVQGTSVDPEPVQFPNITYYPQMYHDAKPVLDELDVDLSDHTSTPISKTDAETADILLAVDDKTQQALQTLFPDQSQKIHLVSEIIDEQRNIIDPEGVSGADKQRQIFLDLQNIATTGFPKLLVLLGIRP